jgi:hypothetical protein
MSRARSVLRSLFLRGACLVLAAALTTLGPPGCGGGGDGEGPPSGEPVVKTLEPGQGITVQQVEFDFPGGSDPNSTWGRLLLDPAALSRIGGVQDGYVSLVTGAGWAVANVPVPRPGEPPHAIFFSLDIKQSMPVGDMEFDVKHSDQALEDVTPYLAQPIVWAVEKWVWQAQGVGPVEEMEIAPPKEGPAVLQFEDLPVFEALTFSHLQAITNVQCAWNQCYPMAWANCLQFLEDQGEITVPHDHSQGIGVTGNATSNTLVGQLDLYANRSVTSRLNGGGVWFAPMIDGVFDYLQDNGLTGALTFRHQDDGYPTGEIPAGSYSGFGSTSASDGAQITWDWIDARIQEGCAVNMVYIAHAVRITGTGRTLGVPWIRYSHDANQASDVSGLENVIAFLSDPDGNGLLNMNGSSHELRFVQAACP